MPLIEVIANSTTSTSLGYAYVPDTGYDPSKAAIVPSGARKRQRNVPVAASGELSSRQKTKIAEHIAELGRESSANAGSIIPVGRPKDVAMRSMNEKMTPGVRRIILSQKTFRNYLDDEEAAIANQTSGGQGQEGPVIAPPRQTVGKAGKSGPGRKPGPKPKTAIPTTPSTTAAADKDIPDGNISSDGKISSTSLIERPKLEKKEDDDPFLRSRIPSLPSDSEIRALTSAPPLSYTAARAGPTASTAPARRFCEMCGYWGRVMCMKCGVRLCGLKCKNAHDESNCAKFYA